ncbi:glycosyltransferase family 87 protein [Pedobacter sp. NJ-S-72]
MKNNIYSSIYFKIVLFIVALLYAIKCGKGGHDFEVFVYAGGKIINGLNIYKPPFVQDLNYYYSPLFALLLAPFSSLPTIVPQLVWIFFSYYLLYRIWILCADYFDVSQLTEKQKQLWITITFILALRFILKEIACVQVTIFLLWATLQSIQLINRGKNISGAALLAFAINIKLLPIAFVCYLLYRKKLKAVSLICLFYVIYLYLPVFYLGWDKNASLLHEWFSVINPANKEWTIEAEDGPSSLVAMIPVYITDTVGILSFKRNFVNLNFEQVSLILNIVRLAFVALTLVFLRTLPFKSVNSKIQQFWEMSSCLLLFR